MPVRKVEGGKGWTFGGSIYKTKATAERAYRAYLAKKHGSQK